MTSYDSFLFKPPAPVSYVTLINPKNNLEKPRIPMLLDTGSDITLVPKFAIENLDLDFSEGKEINLESFDGKKSVSRAVNLFMIFEKHKFRALFPIIEQDYGIIGRNILNKFKVVFDGQKLNWEILSNSE
ncbi:MAG: hypothetical protein ACR2F2_13355 [Pyrinomonadaceae bacterium]